MKFADFIKRKQEVPATVHIQTPPVIVSGATLEQDILISTLRWGWCPLCDHKVNEVPGKTSGIRWYYCDRNSLHVWEVERVGDVDVVTEL